MGVSLFPNRDSGPTIEQEVGIPIEGATDWQRFSETQGTFERTLQDAEVAIFNTAVRQIRDQIRSGAENIDNPLMAGPTGYIKHTASAFPSYYAFFDNLFGDNTSLPATQLAPEFGVVNDEEVVSEDDLLNGDSDLTGDTTAGDLQTSAYMSALQQATSAELETVFGSPDSDIEQELTDILQNQVLAGGGIGVEINPEDGDSFLFKFPIPLPIPGGVLKIKFRNPDGTFVPLPDIIGEVTTKVQAAGAELLALPGKLIDQAEGILGDLIETGEIVAGTSEEDILGKIADIFGGILAGPDGSGMETPSWILEGLRTKLTDAVYNSGVISDEPDPLTPKGAVKKPEDEPERPEVTNVVPDLDDPIRPTTTETTTDQPPPDEEPKPGDDRPPGDNRPIPEDAIKQEDKYKDIDITKDDPPTSCFIAGTKIDMADGTQKNIENIRVGDEVQAIGGTTDTVSYVHDIEAQDHLLWTLNGHITATEAHPFMTEDGWKSANPEASMPVYESYGISIGQLEAGDLLTGSEGVVELTSLESREENVKVYNFTTASTHTYMVDGVVSHNKTPTKFPDPPPKVVVPPDVVEPPDEPPGLPPRVIPEDVVEVIVAPPPDEPPTVVEEVPPSEEGGGGGGGGGMLDGTSDAFYNRDDLGLPRFTPVPYEAPKDYIVSLNRIMKENMFDNVV
jgi:hypothetical protein